MIPAAPHIPTGRFGLGLTPFLTANPAASAAGGSSCSASGEARARVVKLSALRISQSVASWSGSASRTRGLRALLFCIATARTPISRCASDVSQTQTHWLTVARQSAQPDIPPLGAFSCSSTRRAHRRFTDVPRQAIDRRCPAPARLGGMEKDFGSAPQWIATWGNNSWVGEKTASVLSRTCARDAPSREGMRLDGRYLIRWPYRENLPVAVIELGFHVSSPRRDGEHAHHHSGPPCHLRRPATRRYKCIHQGVPGRQLRSTAPEASARGSFFVMVKKVAQPLPFSSRLGPHASRSNAFKRSRYPTGAGNIFRFRPSGRASGSK